MTEFDGLFSLGDTLIIVESKRTFTLKSIKSKIYLLLKFKEFLKTSDCSEKTKKVQEYFNKFKKIKMYIGALFWDVDIDSLFIKNNEIINENFNEIDRNIYTDNDKFNLYKDEILYKISARPDLGIVHYINGDYKIFGSPRLLM